MTCEKNPVISRKSTRFIYLHFVLDFFGGWVYNEHCKKVNRQLDVEIDILLSILQYIDGSVSCDLAKINMGVNPITEYRKRLKRLPKNEDMMSEFHIQFKALTKSDREFLEKERIKNERK